MAAFVFRVTDNDRWVILQSALDSVGVELIIDEQYMDAPQARAYAKIDEEFREMFSRRSSVFVRGPFSGWPIKFCSVDIRNVGKRYYISQSEGGPLLLLMISSPALEHGRMRLNVSMFSYKSRYYDPVTNASASPSVELIEYFKAATGRMKKSLIRVKRDGGSSIWLGKEAAELFRSGKAVL